MQRLYHVCELTRTDWFNSVSDCNTSDEVRTLCGLKIEGGGDISWDFIQDWIESEYGYRSTKKCQKCQNDERLPLLVLASLDE